MLRILVFLLVIGSGGAQAISGEKSYHVTWKKLHDGRIDNDSVCSTYTRGSVDFRGCRGQAQRIFKDQCKTHRKKQPGSKSEFVYCEAARTFNPIF